MTELHTSPHMRKMIAEINLAYSPQLIAMDGVDAFTDGGPDTGELCPANVMIAGTDRVAVDAVGVAILKGLGSNQAIMRVPVFEQEQIARAVQLGLGVSSPEEIEIVTDDDRDSKRMAEQVREILLKG